MVAEIKGILGLTSQGYYSKKLFAIRKRFRWTLQLDCMMLREVIMSEVWRLNPGQRKGGMHGAAKQRLY